MNQKSVLQLIKDNKKEALIVSLIITVYFVIACHKLLNASLWYDEVIEYYFSKTMFGYVPGGGRTINMYQRITSTFQPPLYSVVMFFWLKLSDTVWWFRFGSVVAGFAGSIAIYLSIKKLSNYKVAALSVLIYSCIYRLMYYFQECAEYSLMIAMVCWALYYFISTLLKPSVKNMVLYGLFCSLAVYSQYGAVFFVIGCSIVLLIKVLRSKDRKVIKNLLLTYGALIVVAVLPLYLFFIRIQIANEGVTLSNFEPFPENLFVDFLNNLLDVFKFLFFKYVHVKMYVSIRILAVLFTLIAVLTGIFSKRSYIRYLLLGDIVMWVSYYIAFTLGIYARGMPMSRYSLFLTPIWLLTFIAVPVEFTRCIKRVKIIDTQLIVKIWRWVMIVGVIIFCCLGWGDIRENWKKENSKEVIDTWNELVGEDDLTLVYFPATPSFIYYITHDDSITHDPYDESNIIYFSQNFDSIARYNEYIPTLFDDALPENIYFCMMHYTEDTYDMLLQSFDELGYLAKVEYEGYKAVLLQLTLVE